MRLRIIPYLGALWILGCGAARTDNDMHEVGGRAPAIAGGSSVTMPDVDESNAAIPPIASLHAANGNRIDFYDGGREGILITELGDSYTIPALRGVNVAALGAVNVWNKLSQDIPAPAALVALQERTDNYAEGPESAIDQSQASATSTGASSTEVPMITPGGEVSSVQQAVNLCNNGCCDHDWLDNYLCDTRSDWDDHFWFNFNVGWAWQQNDGIADVHETVCAAIGTSRFGVHRGSYINSFNVAEAHYQYYTWTKGDWPAGTSDNHAVVNTNSNNQPVAPTNLHTFCGSVGRPI